MFATTDPTADRLPAPLLDAYRGVPPSAIMPPTASRLEPERRSDSLFLSLGGHGAIEIGRIIAIGAGGGVYVSFDLDTHELNAGAYKSVDAQGVVRLPLGQPPTFTLRTSAGADLGLGRGDEKHGFFGQSETIGGSVGPVSATVVTNTVYSGVVIGYGVTKTVGARVGLDDRLLTLGKSDTEPVDLREWLHDTENLIDRWQQQQHESVHRLP